jgi:hypothetical protein
MRPIHPPPREPGGVTQRGRSSGATGPTIYQIVVRGELSQRYEVAFEGMTLQRRDGQTTISGPVTDQAHLYGLLGRVGDLGLELVSVNPTPDLTSPAVGHVRS